jgi:ABC-type sugar transport system permease subunit
MEELLFSASKTTLNTLIAKLRAESNDSQFEMDRNGIMISILGSIMQFTDVWDSNTKVTASYIGNSFISRITDALINPDGKGYLHSDSLDEIFSLLYRFALEMDLSASGDLEFDISRMKSFAMENKKLFNSRAMGQIDFANSSLPLSILKGIVNTPGFGSLNEFMRNIKDSKQERDDLINLYKADSERYKIDAEKKQEEWESYIKNKQSEINNLRVSLESYQNAFNFVGLYDGFKSLSDQKNKEKKWSLVFVVCIGVAVFAPLMWEALNSLSSGRKFSTIYDILYLLPVFSITFILIYYFRVALQNHNSIKAQLSQIELRKTLCQFIQSYSDYSTKIKKEDPESLSKFESIIFSSIITNGDNIPSTFDGLEQVVKLISDLKK